MNLPSTWILSVSQPCSSALQATFWSFLLGCSVSWAVHGPVMCDMNLGPCTLRHRCGLCNRTPQLVSSSVAPSQVREGCEGPHVWLPTQGRSHGTPLACSAISALWPVWAGYRIKQSRCARQGMGERVAGGEPEQRASIQVGPKRVSLVPWIVGQQGDPRSRRLVCKHPAPRGGPGRSPLGE